MDPTNATAIPFTYVVTSPTLTASSSGSITLIMQADSRFELTAIFATSSLDANTDMSSNNFSVLITDQTTGRQLSSNRIPQRIFAGTAFNGYLGRRSILFNPQSNLLFDFLNLSGASPNVITLSLVGYKYLIS